MGPFLSPVLSSWLQGKLHLLCNMLSQLGSGKVLNKYLTFNFNYDKC